MRSERPSLPDVDIGGWISRRLRRRRAMAWVIGGFVMALVLQPAIAQADDGTPGERASASAPDAGTSSAAPAGTEPLGPADREFLTKVRLAGLWERLAGQMAAQKGASPRVREIGAMIRDQHAQLDQLVVKAADEVRVPLPDAPNSDQLTWLGEMSAASGPTFDKVFVSRLRAAHGTVFPLVASVRASTRNSVVRKLAQQANDFVLTHLTLLESTGLVDDASLATSVLTSSLTSSATAAATLQAKRSCGAIDSTAWTGWLLALTGTLLGVLRFRRRVVGARRGTEVDTSDSVPVPRRPRPPSPYV